MRAGEVEANLITLNEVFRLPQVPELIAQKLAGPEQSMLEDTDVSFHAAEFARLGDLLRSAFDTSALPERAAPSAAEALDDLLVRLRVGGP
jgi:hypothetical protein